MTAIPRCLRCGVFFIRHSDFFAHPCAHPSAGHAPAACPPAAVERQSMTGPRSGPGRDYGRRARDL